MERIDKTRGLEFVRALRCAGHKEYLEKYFLFSAAPVIAGIKPSVLISFRRCCEKVWKECEEQICEMTNLKTIRLYENDLIFGVLAYDAYALGDKIKTRQAANILKDYGYKEKAKTEELLNILKSRFTENGFPHEIGVFLGYPPKDVGSFIETRGKGYICCQYWKVYHDEQLARETFKNIDKSKSQAIYLIMRKIPLKTAAKKLAAMKNN